MLKRLRTKIVLINMLSVGAVMLAVFLLLCVGSYQSARNEVDRALHSALEADGRMGVDPAVIGRPGGRDPQPPDGPDRNRPTSVATVTVRIDGYGAAVLSENGATLSDELAAAACAAARADGGESGWLRELGLLYRLSADGSLAAFADADALFAAPLRTAALSAAALAAGLVAFFFLSLWLSALAVRPVGEAWDKQNRFVSEASHELKTPLTVILANTSILAAHPDETVRAQSQWVDNTVAEATRMKQLIDRLLTLARCDDGRTRTVLSETDLSAATEEQVLSFEPVAFERKLTIECETDPGVTALTDPELYARLVSVYLDNAVKYAAPGSVISVTLRRRGTAATLAVRDFGEVIPPGELDLVFDRFYRADKARSAEGFGLGLSIAAEMAKLMGARLSAESSAEGGTVFRAELKCFSERGRGR